MKTKERHISTEKKLIIGIIIGIILLAGLLYLFHTRWNGLYIVNNVPTSFVGVGIIIVISLTICTIFVLGFILLGIHFPPQFESEKQIKNLPNDFVNVDIKKFDNFSLSKFISRDDISCIAKLDEDGKITYSFNVKVKFYQTDDYELFLKYFDI